VSVHADSGDSVYGNAPELRADPTTGTGIFLTARITGWRDATPQAHPGTHILAGSAAPAGQKLRQLAAASKRTSGKRRVESRGGGEASDRIGWQEIYLNRDLNQRREWPACGLVDWPEGQTDPYHACRPLKQPRPRDALA
jgi:hypothetical protein